MSCADFPTGEEDSRGDCNTRGRAAGVPVLQSKLKIHPINIYLVTIVFNLIHLMFKHCCTRFAEIITCKILNIEILLFSAG